VRTLTDAEAAALTAIDRIGGDFGDCTDDGVLELDLVARGLVSYFEGPYTVRCMSSDDPPDGPIDPVVTPRGRLALLCRQLAGALS
jgi:hypothetical protein